MFGYIKAYASELRVREAEYYRAVYCGLCRAMRKTLGVSSAAALSYDIVFLILTRMALAGDNYDVRRRRCPFKLRRRLMAEPGREIIYGAAASSLLTARKLDDDINDESGAKRLVARAVRPISRRHLRRAGADKALVDAVDAKLAEIYALEASQKSGERAFGELLGAVFSHGLEGGPAKIAYAIGEGAGRTIYLLDAIDDAEGDSAAGRWNPLSDALGSLPEDHAAEAMREAVRLTIAPAGAASELIDCRDDGGEALGIVKNILFLGIPNEADRIIKKHFEGGKGKA